MKQWAGHDAAVAQREAEIQRLERLVWDAIYELQKAGQDTRTVQLIEDLCEEYSTRGTVLAACARVLDRQMRL